MQTLRIKIIIGALCIIVLAAIGYLILGSKVFTSPEPTLVPELSGIEYRNMECGFSVALPESWRGYSVSIDKWTGYRAGDELGEIPFASGPVVSIHNPKWTGANTYQDIPIMVFTNEQWEALQTEKFHIGAAPIGPSELGRNAKYIFALPARYNFAFPPGYEEVESILQGKPLKTF